MRHTKLHRTGVKKRRTPFYLGTVKNSPQGRELISCLSTLYKPYGKVNKKGRNPNRVKLSVKTGIPHSKLRVSVPARYSTRFDVYLRQNIVNWTERFDKGIKGVPPYYKLPLCLLKMLVMVKR